MVVVRHVALAADTSNIRWATTGEIAVGKYVSLAQADECGSNYQPIKFVFVVDTPGFLHEHLPARLARDGDPALGSWR